MRDSFLMQFVESQQNYDSTICWLIKHHPICLGSDADFSWKEAFVCRLVHDAIREVIFGRENIFYDITNMLVVTELWEDTVLLSVIPR